MLRAHGLEQASDEWLADTDRFRPFFVGRGDWAVSTDETLAGLRELSAERALRYANYLAIADDLAPTTPFVRFSPDEMCWRLPVLLRDQEVRQSVVERVRARGALISDHYFPASFLFGQPGGCPNARAIGLRAANLWVDEKARDMPVDWIAEQINAAAA
jgi:hypothetical protein